MRDGETHSGCPGAANGREVIAAPRNMEITQPDAEKRSFLARPNRRTLPRNNCLLLLLFLFRCRLGGCSLRRWRRWVRRRRSRRTTRGRGVFDRSGGCGWVTRNGRGRRGLLASSRSQSERDHGECRGISRRKYFHLLALLRLRASLTIACLRSGKHVFGHRLVRLFPVEMPGRRIDSFRSRCRSDLIEHDQAERHRSVND
jgi:hypothetical protein